MLGNVFFFLACLVSTHFNWKVINFEDIAFIFLAAGSGILITFVFVTFNENNMDEVFLEEVNEHES
jgi:hypothetical protein